MKVYSFFNKCLQIICLLVVSVIFVLNFIYTTTISYDPAEKVTIYLDVVNGVLLLALACLIIYSVLSLRKYLEKVNEMYVFLAFSLVYILMATYLICNIDHTFRADAYFISESAKNFLAGSRSMFDKGGYFYFYPHQIGLLFYDALLYLICKHNVINFIANLVFILGINFLVYKISELMFNSRLVNNLSIIMAFVFVPQFFFIAFAYGTVPGLFFILLAFYFTLRFCKKHSYVDLAITVVSCCVAVMLRKNFIIAVIAIIIFLGLDLLKKFSFKHLVLIVCILVSLILPTKVLPNSFVKGTDGTPSLLWVAMGTDIDNNYSGPGWFDGSATIIFGSNDFDSEKAKEQGKDKLSENIQKIKAEPLAACKFFHYKNVSQWTDPLFQSIWTGPLEYCGQQTKTTLLKSLYGGGTAENILATIMKAYMLGFWGLCLIYIIRHRKEHDGWQLCFLMLIGGFLFHTFWEAKSQYVYPYFFSLIPFAAYAMSKIVIEPKALAKKAE